MDANTVVRFAGKYFSYAPTKNSSKVDLNVRILERMVSQQFEKGLVAKNYEVRKRYSAYKVTDAVPQPNDDIFSAFKGFTYRVLSLEDSIFLCVDPHLFLRTNCTIHDLAARGIPAEELHDFPVRYLAADKTGIDGYLIDTSKRKDKGYSCKVKTYRRVEQTSSEETINGDRVFPESRPELIQRFLSRLGVSYSVISLQRQYSFLDSRTASRDRFLSTLDTINVLSKEVFPLEFGDFTVTVKTQPVVVKL